MARRCDFDSDKTKFLHTADRLSVIILRIKMRVYRGHPENSSRMSFGHLVDPIVDFLKFFRIRSWQIGLNNPSIHPIFFKISPKLFFCGLLIEGNICSNMAVRINDLDFCFLLPRKCILFASKTMAHKSTTP